MVEFERRDLICLHLDAHADARERTPVPPAVSATGIGDALEVGDAVANRVRLLDELATLRDEGLATTDERPVEGYDIPRTVYFLTGDGREHAATVREELQEESVVVTGDGSEVIPLADVDRYVDGPAPIVTALARLTDAGRVPLERRPGDPFVDREAPLAALREAIEASITRQSRTVVVEGAAGMGKTALVDEAIDRVGAAREDVVVARGVCSDGPSAPYAPLRQAFGSVVGGDDLAARLADARASVTPDDPAQVDARRTALFDDVADELRTAAEDRPVVVFLDNLHWADEATLQLFAHLATTITGWLYPVAFVGTYRPAAAAGGDPTLADTLDRIESETACHELRLEPLARADTATMLAGDVGREQLPEPFVDLIHERTGGVPLFVRETAAHLLERGVVDPERDRYPARPDELTLPEAVTEQVDQRLASLEGPGRTLVELGAVVGEHVRSDVLAAASDLPAPTRREYVDALVASRIWARGGEDDPGGDEVVAERDGASDGHDEADLRFVSGGVREAIVEGLSEATAREYHERVARAYLDVDDNSDERAARIAHHFEQAGAPERALSFYRRAGAYARETYAHEEAIGHYERALSLATGGGVEYESVAENEAVGTETASPPAVADPTDAATAADVTADIAGVYETTGELDRALATARAGLDRAPDASRERCRLLGVAAAVHAARSEFDEARESAREQRDLAADLGVTDLRAAAIRRLGAVAVERGRYDRAREQLRRSLELFRDVGDRRGEADSLDDLGAVARNQGDYERARERFERSLDIGRDLGDRRGVASSLKNLGTVTYYQGNYDEARRCYDRCLEIARELGDRQMEADGLNNLGLVAHERGDYDEAERYYERSLDIERELGNRQGEANSLNNLGLVAQIRSEYDRAREYHARSLEIERELGDRQGEANSLNNLGVVAQYRGEWDRARECYEQSLEIARELGDRQRESYSLGNLGLVAERRGEYDRARERFEAALAIKRELGDRKGEATRLNNRGLVDVRRGAYDRARDAFRESLAIARELGEQRETAQSLNYLGEVARLRGAYDRAREYHERSLDVAVELGDRGREVENRLNMGRIALRDGVPDRAREAFERALEIARDLDTPRSEGDGLAGLGMAALQRGDLGTATERFDAAMETFETVGDPFGVARVRLRSARLALERDDLEAARERAQLALDSFAELGATHWIGRSRHLLGEVAAASDESTDGREQFEAALVAFEAVDATSDALGTLAALVEIARERGNVDRSRELRRRAEDLLSDAPPPVVARHRRWIDRTRSG